jgi:hypothetical protein
MLTLASCTLSWKQDASLIDAIFEKKQECAKYKDTMLKDAMDYHTEWMTRTWDSYELTVTEIFYSPISNSCMYELSIYKQTDIWEWPQKFLLNKYLYDYFSKKEIISTIHSNNEELSIIEEAYLKKLQELKWI